MLRLQFFFKKLCKYNIHTLLIVVLCLTIIYHYTKNISLPITSIEIIGNNNFTAAQLDLPALGENLIVISLEKIYKQISSDKWVKSAIVKKIFPYQIKIIIEEYKPFAIWNDIFLIDKEGHTITESTNKNNLLSVHGKEANLNFYHFMQDLNLELNITKIKALEYINTRRWNIIFYTDLKVKLPENNAKQVWKKALEIIDRYSLLENNIATLDMRNTDKIFINKFPLNSSKINKHG